MRCRAADELDQALLLMGKIRPAFTAGSLGGKLDAADDEAQFGLFLQHTFQPLPLRGAEHGGREVICRHGIATGGGLFFGDLFQRAAEVTRVQHDDLSALAFRTIDAGLIDAFLLPKRRASGLIQPVPELFLRLLFHRVIRAAVVLTEIVIIPGGEHGHAAVQALEKRTLPQSLIPGPHHGHVGGIGINIVSHEQKEIHGQRQRASQHGVVCHVQAGTKNDVFQGGFGLIEGKRKTHFIREKHGEFWVLDAFPIIPEHDRQRCCFGGADFPGGGALWQACLPSASHHDDVFIRLQLRFGMAGEFELKHRGNLT